MKTFLARHSPIFFTLPGILVRIEKSACEWAGKARNICNAFLLVSGSVIAIEAVLPRRLKWAAGRLAAGRLKLGTSVLEGVLPRGGAQFYTGV